MNLRLLPVPLAALLAFSPGCTSTDPTVGTGGTPAAPPAVGWRDETVRDRSPARPLSDYDRHPPTDALMNALHWLARHQSPDGRWSSDGFGAACGGAADAGGCDGAGEAGYDVGVTGLALLTFHEWGFSRIYRDDLNGIRVGDVVKKGLQWLVSRQKADGCIGGKDEPQPLLQHAIATLALIADAELAHASGKEPAGRAIDFIVRAQNSGAGWRSPANRSDGGTFVTGLCAMTLIRVGGLIEVPRAALDGARDWLDHVTDADGRAGNDRPGSDPVVRPGRNERFASHDTMTAIAMTCRMFMDRTRKDPRIVKGAGLLTDDLPAWDGPRIDFCYWHFGTDALFFYDGTHGPRWTPWNESTKNAIESHQRAPEDGCRAGSWDPVDRWGSVGGRVYATAINCRTLHICHYHYNTLFLKEDRQESQKQ